MYMKSFLMFSSQRYFHFFNCTGALELMECFVDLSGMTEN